MSVRHPTPKTWAACASHPCGSRCKRGRAEPVTLSAAVGIRGSVRVTGSQLNRWFLTRRKGLVQRGERAAAARRRTGACRPLGAIHRTDAPHPKVCDAKQGASLHDAYQKGALQP
jgi:hypothetical protein